MTVTRAAIYARVSTYEQDPENQARELKDYVERRSWGLVGEYTDQGISGARDRRPALDRLMADVRRRKVDVVAVWALDRLGRSLRHLVNLGAELEALGVGLACYTQPIDTTTPAGKLTFQVLGACAEFERAMIRERVRAGLARARSCGKRLGRPRSWTTDQIERAGRLRAAGSSWTETAREVGLPVGTIRTALAAVRETADSHQAQSREAGLCQT
jgi:DNA invertase Pin-like site-specific DNA recombinase